MFSFLKQSTASQTRLIGPWLDDTDFKTPETGLTIANTDLKLSKNGAAAANKNSGGGTHISNGMYAVTFDATDTGTVGELSYTSLVAGALLVVGKFWVLEESIYDALFGASAAGFNASGLVTLAAVTHTGAVIPTVTTLTGHTAQTGDSFARLGAPAGASVSVDVAAIKTQTAAIEVDTQDLQTQVGTDGSGLTNMPWNASWDAEVQSECADALTAYDPPTQTELLAAHSTTDGLIGTVDTVVDAIKAKTDNLPSDPADQSLIVAATDALATLIGSPVASVSADIAAVKAETAAIVADTNELQVDNTPGALAALDAKIDAIDTVVDAVLIDTAEIGAAGAGLTSLPEVQADMVKVNGSAPAAMNLAASALGIVRGACEGVPTATEIPTDLTEATDDHYIGRVVVFTSGAAAGEASSIEDYVGATGTLTVAAMATAAAATDAFVIV